MVKLYMSDIPEFSKDDWEDMLTTYDWAPEFDWDKAFVWKGDVVLQFPEHEMTRDLSSRQVLFCPQGEREKPIQWREDTEYLLKDLVDLKDIRNALYRLSNDLYDRKLEDEINYASDEFGKAYDEALGRALVYIVKELQDMEEEKE